MVDVDGGWQSGCRSPELALKFVTISIHPRTVCAREVQAGTVMGSSAIVAPFRDMSGRGPGETGKFLLSLKL